MFYVEKHTQRNVWDLLSCLHPPSPKQSCSAIFSRSFLAEHNIEYRGEGDIMYLWADVLNYLQTLRVSQVFLQLVVATCSGLVPLNHHQHILSIHKMHCSANGVQRPHNCLPNLHKFMPRLCKQFLQNACLPQKISVKPTTDTCQLLHLSTSRPTCTR